MITQNIKPICHKANPLPHELTGELEIGTIAPNTGAVVCISSTSIQGANRFYPVISDVDGLIKIQITDEHKCFYSAFEDCCYKVTVVSDGCPISFQIGGIDYDCVLMCLQIDCDAEGPYKLQVCSVEEVETNCNRCQ